MSQEDGSVEMVLDIREGKVIQEFQEPMKRVVYEPNNALAVAMKMSDLAFQADTGMKPVNDTLKSEIVERHRMTCTQRGANMLGTLRKDSRLTDGQVAQRLVEMVLKEVF